MGAQPNARGEAPRRGAAFASCQERARCGGAASVALGKLLRTPGWTLGSGKYGGANGDQVDRIAAVFQFFLPNPDIFVRAGRKRCVEPWGACGVCNAERWVGGRSPDKISSCPYLTRHSGGRSPTNMHNALSVRGTVRGVAVTRREIPCSICGAGAGRAPGKIWNRGYLTRYAACQGHIVKKTNVRIEAKDATRQVGETSGGGRSPANWSSLPI